MVALYRLVIIVFGLLCVIEPVCAWNLNGHRLVAQIAVDNLQANEVKACNRINHYMDVAWQPMSLVNAAIWMDVIRFHGNNWYFNWHFVNQPFTKTNMPLPAVAPVNAVWAIQSAITALENKHMSHYEHGFALRVLMHVTGDLHQPMHAVSLVSLQYPNGDKGGNLYPVINHGREDNLHAYWDSAAGFLPSKGLKPKAIKRLANMISKEYPCHDFDLILNPEIWLNESHQLAANHAYSIHEGARVDRQYEQQARAISKKRMAMAGCRLAKLMQRLCLSS